MNPSDVLITALLSLIVLNAVVMLVLGGWPPLSKRLDAYRDWLDRMLNQRLLLGVPPQMAMTAVGLGVVICGLVMYLFVSNWLGLIVGAALGLGLPVLVINHLQQKRREQLEDQIVDGVITLASGLRAGLTIVQAFENVAENSSDPLRQELRQLLREYKMGMDLNQCMANASDRIGSQHYRLLFTALEMHRQRGGDAAESLDRLAESIRQIRYLEGKLDAITAQGRYQAWAMLMAVPALLLMMYLIVDPTLVEILFSQAEGRMMLGVAILLSVAAFFWIRRIMAVDM
jgi:tight adherence protein B